MEIDDKTKPDYFNEIGLQIGDVVRLFWEETRKSVNNSFYLVLNSKEIELFNLNAKKKLISKEVFLYKKYKTKLIIEEEL